MAAILTAVIISNDSQYAAGDMRDKTRWRPATVFEQKAPGNCHTSGCGRR
jgi:hypothetical protein